MPFDDRPRSAQAAIMCTWPDFQTWLGVSDKIMADRALKERTGVLSKTEFDNSMMAAGQWEATKLAFRRETAWTFR